MGFQSRTKTEQQETRRDLAEEVSTRIAGLIESGTAPWRKGWTGSTAGIPLNHEGKPYRGGNILILWMEAAAKDHKYDRWMTFKQANEYGGHVRKGERSATIFYNNIVEKEDQDTGEKQRFFIAKPYPVFNVAQIDGLPERFHENSNRSRDIGTKADPELDRYWKNYAKGTGIGIRSSDDPRAYYSPALDQIHMPPVGTFHSVTEYYATLAHEATHSTGHHSRLGRLDPDHAPKRTEYAQEELVAEIGACILLAAQGLQPDLPNSAAYIRSWLKALRNDKTWIFRTASAAQKAVDFIDSKQPEKERVFTNWQKADEEQPSPEEDVQDRIKAKAKAKKDQQDRETRRPLRPKQSEAVR